MRKRKFIDWEATSILGTRHDVSHRAACSVVSPTLTPPRFCILLPFSRQNTQCYTATTPSSYCHCPRVAMHENGSRKRHASFDYLRVRGVALYLRWTSIKHRGTKRPRNKEFFFHCESSIIDLLIKIERVRTSTG